MPGNSRLATTFLLAIALSPLAAVLASILAYGVDVPWIDEWIAIGSLFEERTLGTLDLLDLTAQHNEHRIFFPKLICLALGSWGAWDVRRETIATFLLAAGTAWNIHALLKATVGGGTRRVLTLFFLVNLLIFSPTQSANWLKGMQMALFLPPLCLTGALRLALSRRRSWVRIGGGMLFCTISTFSVGNGVLCWIAMLPLWLVGFRSDAQSRTKVSALWLAGLALNLGLYAYGYERPRNRLPVLFAFAHPRESLEYFASFLGASLTPIFGAYNKTVACLLGGACFLLFLCACVGFLREGGRTLERTLPWIVIGLYSVLTAAMTTVARVGTVKGSPLASRYVTLSLYVAVALVPLIAILVDSRTRELVRTRISLAGVVAAGFLGIAAVGAWAPSLRLMKEERRAHLQGKACLHFAAVLEDLPGLNILHPRFPGLRRRILMIDRGGFFSRPLARSRRAQDVAGDSTVSCGSFEHLVREGDLFVADGHDVLPWRREPADAILLAYDRVDADPAFFAMFIHGPRREADLIDGSAAWEARFEASKLPPDAVSVSAWAFDALACRAYRLDGVRASR